MSSSKLAGAAMAADCHHHFPDDIVIEILSRLPVKSLLRFRCVCKNWCDLIKHPSFITKHLSQTTILNNNTSNNEHLITLTWRNSIHKYVISMLCRDRGRQTLDSPINLEFPFPDICDHVVEIVGSCNGLVCVSLCGNGSRVVLWNPATREHRNLPAPGISIRRGTSRCDLVILGCGFDPYINDFKMVRMLGFNESLTIRVSPTPSVGEVYSKVKDSWREIDANVQCRPLYSRPPPTTAVVSGGMHWMVQGSDNRHFILCFDMGKELFQEMSLPESYDYKDVYMKQLGVVDDSLSLMVYDRMRIVDSNNDIDWWSGYSNNYIDLWVMKDYGVKESWTRQARIGPISAAPMHMTCFKNGELVLQDIDNENELFLYDSNTQKFGKFPASRDASNEIHTYMESLISVNGGY